METEKFKLYDTAFKFGFVFNMLTFVVLNIINYNRAIERWARLDFSGYGVIWGFPLDMIHFETFSLNIVIIAACGFIMGLAFRFAWQRTRKIHDILQEWSIWTAMKDLMKNKAFVFGSLFGVLLFFLIGATIESRRRGTTICFDCVEEYGFPFTYLETGGFVTIKKIFWFGLVADVLIAIIFSLLIGLFCKFIWSKFSPQGLK